MYTYINNLIFLSLLALTAIIFQGCSKEDSISEPIVEIETETPFELYLTDCPFEADEVNVEILSVILEDENGEIESLITNAGIFNLLDFTDGIDTLLAFGDISITNIENIHIELGDRNTIVVDGETFPLQLVENNTVTINVDLGTIDHLAFLVDFFACTSIVQDESGYFLNPIIKFKGDRESSQELIEDIFEDFEECYQLVYPISFIAKNDQTLIANDRMGLINILIDNEIKDVIFPINLLDPTGNTISINTVEDVSLLTDCDLLEEEEEEEIDELMGLLEKLDECYDIVFPISLLDTTGDAIEANNIEDLVRIFENNEIDNVVLPIQLIDVDSTTIEINEAFELLLLDLDC